MLRVITVCLAMGGISTVSGWQATSLNSGAVQSFTSDLLADMHRQNLGLAAKIEHVSGQLVLLSVPQHKIDAYLNGWRTKLRVQRQVYSERQARQPRQDRPAKRSLLTAPELPKKVVAVRDKDSNVRPDAPPLPSRPNNILANNWATSTVIEQPVHASIPLPEQMWRLKAAYQFMQTKKVTRYAANKQPKAAPRAARKKRTKWRRPPALGMAKPRKTAVLRPKKTRTHRRRTSWKKHVFLRSGEW